MVVGTQLLALALAFASVTTASPCPFGQLHEEGKLSAVESSDFLAVRAEGGVAAERMIKRNTVKKSKREVEQIQNEFHKRQLLGGLLPLGGGLVNGLLQPFRGILQDLDVPTPQEFSLKIIPDSKHPFIQPKKTDVRGMCPTLNTMANHGFIARNGITTFAEAANACQITLGFGFGTCTFLSALGLLAGGDLVTGKMSIGGQDSRVPNTLGPALGNSHHGPFEVDQSISRQDTYFGNNAEFKLDRFNKIVKTADEQFGGFFDIGLWNAERQRTFVESKSTNPEFDAGVKHLAVTLAERVFIFRALPNGSHPELADKQNVLPFYLNETFPKQWFRRDNPYELPEVGTDVASLFLLGPTIPGVNQGMNNFVPLQADLFNLEAGNAECFLMNTLLTLVPGQFSPAIAESVDVVNAFINGAVLPLFTTNGCADDYVASGGTVGINTPGQSVASGYLVNGKYVPYK